MPCKCAAIAEALLRDHRWFKLQRWASKWMRRLQALWRSPLWFAVITHWMGDIKKLLTPSRFSAITERFPHRSASQSFSHLEMWVPPHTTIHTSKLFTCFCCVLINAEEKRNIILHDLCWHYNVALLCNTEKSDDSLKRPLHKYNSWPVYNLHRQR